MANHKPKILFMIPTLEGGGSEKVFYSLLTNISKEKFDITVGVVSRPGVYYEKLPNTINKVLLGVWRVKYAGIKIFQLIRRVRPAIIFTFNVNHLNLVVIPIVLLFGSKIKFITRESNILSVVNAKKGKLSSFMNGLYKLLYKRVDYVICQSEYMQTDMVKNFGVTENKCQVMPNPLVYHQIVEASYSEKFLLKPDYFNVLAVGRLTYQKGYDLLIKALPYIKNDKVHITVLGGETYENPTYNRELFALVEQLGVKDKITFKGFQNNPYPYMLQADALVLPSRHEGFPNVALEAMALGTPVISFNSPGGQNDLIIHNVNGWLVEYGNIRKLAEAIDRASEIQWDRQAITKRVQENYEVKRVVEKYKTFFLVLVMETYKPGEKSVNAFEIEK